MAKLTFIFANKSNSGGRQILWCVAQSKLNFHFHFKISRSFSRSYSATKNDPRSLVTKNNRIYEQKTDYILLPTSFLVFVDDRLSSL